MTADRDIDALVAEKVFGLKRVFGGTGVNKLTEFLDCGCVGSVGCEPYQQKHYSTSISDAWLVVEEMRRLGFYPLSLRLDRYGGSYSGGEWVACFGCIDDGAHGNDLDASEYWADPPAGVAANNSAPRAIALAALRALGVEVES